MSDHTCHLRGYPPPRCLPCERNLTAKIRRRHAALEPWLLVRPEDANEVDYISAQQRRDEMGGRLPR